MKVSEKQSRYFELVECLKKDYSNRKIPLQDIYAEWCRYCNTQINLWSYWQGSLDAQILLLGQDWGNFNPQLRKRDRIMLSNLISIDEGKPALYFDGIATKNISVTDRNIMTLFSELGSEYKDIRKRNDKLFFTNLCLGYRNKGFSGKLQQEWFSKDIKYLVGVDNQENRTFGLLEIIMPDVVICLGKKTYEAVVSELLQKRIEINDFYSVLDAHTNFEDVAYHGKVIRFFAVAHPGGMGTANRKRYCSIDSNTKNGIELQKGDWREIGRYLREKDKEREEG